jgi:prepilin-type N-terminal cleavage/methylation domain-containing protein
MRSRRGFSFIELLTVMIVIGILASIALLKYRDFTNEALAARIGTDMETVRLAALNYYSETGNWPPEAAPGQVPAELVRFLPDGWRFATGSYELDWENLGGVVGVTVRSDRDGLIEKLSQRFVRGNPFVNMGGTVMYIIVAPGVPI